MTAGFEVARLTAGDIARFREMLDMFGRVFDEPDTYSAAQPDDAYAARFLGDGHNIALCAIADGRVVGGLVAYELQKFEQARSELFIYDLAVEEAHRRRGIATALIRWLQAHAATCGAWVIIVEADEGDEAPIALYDKLGTHQIALHFNIMP